MLRKLEETDTQAYWTIRLLCQPDTAGKMKEYFQGTIEKTNPDASFLYTMRVPKQEYFWYAKLLGMGAGVRVLEPQELID
ncbi:WYL domain-containing protein, partial [Anaerostipes caccae]|uniref:WYL domain-containing protein n=1 Tax=Anaerostipes caccae TaxID=105841 RepID=UPI0029F4A451